MWSKNAANTISCLKVHNRETLRSSFIQARWLGAKPELSLLFNRAVREWMDPSSIHLMATIRSKNIDRILHTIYNLTQTSCVDWSSLSHGHERCEDVSHDTFAIQLAKWVRTSQFSRWFALIGISVPQNMSGLSYKRLQSIRWCMGKRIMHP